MKKQVCLLWQRMLSLLFGVPLLSCVAWTAAPARVHLFGSGASAEGTRTLVREGEPCFACNHAVKWREEWECVFVETVDYSPYGLEQIDLLKRIFYAHLLCKNNYPYQPLRSLRKMQMLRRFPRLALLPEYQAAGQSVAEAAVRAANNSHPQCAFPQYASSILTMLIFAVRSGAKEICLHGVDSLSRSEQSQDVHATESFTIPFSHVFAIVREKLHRTGITIVLATELQQ